MLQRLLQLALPALMTGLLLTGCGNLPTRQTQSAQLDQLDRPVQGPSEPTPEQDGFPPADSIPADIMQTPDAVPRVEPESALGNPPSYEVFGKVYHVRNRQDAQGFVQEGRASWYGKKFQGKPTSSGQPYNMFKMTAAHKTLPIPSYVKVTDLNNGKSVVVRVNDRGPFHNNRIIDLSYAAAARLGMLKQGSTRVRVRLLTPQKTPTELAPTDSASASGQIATAYHPQRSDSHISTNLYLQVGKFSDPINAASLRDRLQDNGVTRLTLRSVEQENATATRVLVGPFSDQHARQVMREQLLALNISSLPVER